MTSAALFGHTVAVDRVYADRRRERLAELTDLYPHVIDAANLDEHLPSLADVEVIFSTWGQPVLSPQHLRAMGNLKALFYAAGSVRAFAPPLLDRDVLVVSAWQVNGERVAEFALAQILLAAKGYFRNCREYHAGRGDKAAAFRGPGVFEFPVSLLGAGAVARHLISLLKPFSIHVCVFDPYLSDDDARRLGVQKVSLTEAFEGGMVVSNHVPNNDQTRGMIGRDLLERMPAGGTFINTGRGATVIEPDLVDVLRSRGDLTALLDVTDPEPPPADSPLFDLPNAHLTTHIAGSLGREVIRMADFVTDQFLQWQQGRPVQGQITPDMLATLG